MTRLILIAVLGIAGCGNVMQTQPARTPRAMTVVKVLAIGNSFSANATNHLDSMVRSADCTLVFGHACIGGCSLKTHWEYADMAEKEPDNPNSKPYYYRGKPASLKDLLVAESWDVVTLQQYSMDSFKLETFRPYAKQLRDYIRRYAPQARVAIHETWAYRQDDPLFAKGFSQEEMFRRLRANYYTIARELGAEVIPVGDAFERARLDPQWKADFPDPRFNYVHPRYPRLPEQSHSLNTGYSWVKDEPGWRLAYDGHHANANGEYLGAAVWFEFLFGPSAVGNEYVPRDVTSADAAILARIAHETVSRIPIPL